MGRAVPLDRVRRAWPEEFNDLRDTDREFILRHLEFAGVRIMHPPTIGGGPRILPRDPRLGKV